MIIQLFALLVMGGLLSFIVIEGVNFVKTAADRRESYRRARIDKLANKANETFDKASEVNEEYIKPASSRVRKEFENARDKFKSAISEHSVLQKYSLERSGQALLASLRNLDNTMTEKNLSSLQKEKIEINISDQLNKLSEAIGPKYYVSIVKNPKYWETPREKLDNVKAALKNVYETIEENIRTINSDSEVEINIALDSINDASNSEVENIYRETSEADRIFKVKNDGKNIRNSKE